MSDLPNVKDVLQNERSVFQLVASHGMENLLVIPRSQHKALMAAAGEFFALWGNGRSCECPSCARRNGIIAALRAAGVIEEEKG